MLLLLMHSESRHSDPGERLRAQGGSGGVIHQQLGVRFSAQQYFAILLTQRREP
jgi:hypothetical protein